MIHIIVNPRAGSSRGIRTFRELEPELIKYKVSYDVLFTQYPGHASEEAARLCRLEAAPRIAVLGGDGTMHEVLEGIRLANGGFESKDAPEGCGSPDGPDDFAGRGGSESSGTSAGAPVSVTLMFLACGSGNDFARGLHLTRDPARFAELLSRYDQTNAGAANAPDAAGRLIPLRYGCGHTQGVSQGFFVSGGMGFDSSVTEEITVSPLKPLANRLHLSTLAYLFLGIRQIIAEPQAPARIVVDGKKQLKTDRLFFLSAHKMRCEGGGFPFAPHADPTSDSLAVCIFYGMNRAACTWALFLSLFGLHRYKKGVALLNCQKVEVFSETLRSTHTDGETLGFVDHVCFTAGESARQTADARIQFLLTRA